MTSLLLCWYALGWSMTGLGFAACAEDDDFSQFTPFNVFVCFFLLAPLWLGILVAASLVRIARRIDTSKQYLWRKP